MLGCSNKHVKSKLLGATCNHMVHATAAQMPSLSSGIPQDSLSIGR